MFIKSQIVLSSQLISFKTCPALKFYRWANIYSLPIAIVDLGVFRHSDFIKHSEEGSTDNGLRAIPSIKKDAKPNAH